jgi:hypothetical protein
VPQEQWGPLAVARGGRGDVGQLRAVDWAGTRNSAQEEEIPFLFPTIFPNTLE